MWLPRRGKIEFLTLGCLDFLSSALFNHIKLLFFKKELAENCKYLPPIAHHFFVFQGGLQVEPCKNHFQRNTTHHLHKPEAKYTLFMSNTTKPHECPCFSKNKKQINKNPLSEALSQFL